MLPLLPTTMLVVSALAGLLPAQQTLRFHRGDFSDEQYSRVTATLGDVDNDGVADYAIAVRTNNINPRTATLVDVRSGRDGSLIHRLTGTQNDRFGESVGGIPDTDGDGHDDILVGAPLTRIGSSQAGNVRLYSGRTGNLLRTFEPGTSTSNQVSFGTGIATLSDVDGDGVHDFLCTIPNLEVTRLVSGRTGAQIYEVLGSRLTSAAPVAVLGDLDGDNTPDFVTAAPSSRDDSVVWVRSGATGQLLFSYTGRQDQELGRGLAGVDDVDGDGTPDFALGAPREPDPMTGEPIGAVHLYSGSDGRLLYTRFGPGLDHARFGSAIARCHDLDGDGTDDLAVTASGDGSLWILSGTTGDILAEMLSGLVGNGGLSPLDDLDGDGTGELLVGAPLFSGNGENQGAAYVLSPRLRARTVRMPTDCGAGPWLPQLGSTRPFLGETATISGRDAPAGTTGILFLAAGHPAPFDFGFEGCDVFVDVGSAVQLPLPATSSWSLQLPIPAVGGIAGARFALQCAYGPTRSRVGFDLSNGLRWFLGE